MTQNNLLIVWAVLLTLSLLGCFFFALPFLMGIVNIGNLAGLAASMLLLLSTLLRKPFGAWLQRRWQQRAGKITISAVGGVIAAGLLLCLVLSVMMTVAANRKPKQQPAAVIVLGCKVNGTQPSLMLSRRLNAAYDYLVAHPNVPVVVSGGQGSNEEISEAQCMADYLVAKGIASDRILLEEQSTSTAENLRFSETILAEQKIAGEYMLVTDAFHQYRAQYLAKEEGMTCYAVSAHTSWYLLPTYWVREWFGILHAWVFGA